MTMSPMDYVLKREDGGRWIVERVRSDLAGQREHAAFTGYQARDRAEQYQALMKLIAKTFVDERDGSSR